MVKISLQIKANFENIDELYTNHPDHNFILKLKCSNCGEVSDKWHDVTESQTFPTKVGKCEMNYVASCKFCGRENSLDIIKGSNGRYTGDDVERFKSIVSFDCRGFEPVEFCPSDGWVAKVEESGKVFDDVDLSEKEWVEYDDKAKRSVGVFAMESQFVKIK